MPSFPAGRNALLGALSDWMAAEKRTREASVATEPDVSPGSAYLKRLEGWTRRLHSVPRLTKPVRKSMDLCINLPSESSLDEWKVYVWTGEGPRQRPLGTVPIVLRFNAGRTHFEATAFL